MKLTANDIQILATVARYYALSASMIHRLCFPHRKDQRHTRRRLAALAREKLVRKSPVSVAFSTGNSGPVYTPASDGCDALAVYYNDDAWLSTNTRAPRMLVDPKRRLRSMSGSQMAGFRRHSVPRAS